MAVDGVGSSAGASGYQDKPGSAGSGPALQLASNPAVRIVAAAGCLAGLLQVLHLASSGGGEGAEEVRSCCWLSAAALQYAWGEGWGQWCAVRQRSIEPAQLSVDLGQAGRRTGLWLFSLLGAAKLAEALAQSLNSACRPLRGLNTS